MKNRGMLIMLITAVLSFALGATGAVRIPADARGGDAAEGRLIGVFVTKEHLDLFDYDGYLRDHADQLLSGGEIRKSEQKAYEGRLYATLTDGAQTDDRSFAREYAFDAIDGVRYFAATIADDTGDAYLTSGDEAISDGHMSVSVTDEGEMISLDGTIYVSTKGDTDIFYINPVYQEASGNVYAVTGNGVSFGGDRVAGSSHSVKLEEKQTATVNGETAAYGVTVRVSLTYQDAPEDVAILFYGANGALIARDGYMPGALPETVNARPGTEYIIVETRALSDENAPSVIRALYQKADESLFAFRAREDGILIKQWCEIRWN